MSLRKNRKHERHTPAAQQPAKGAPWALIAVVIVAVAAGAGIVASRYSDDDPATLTASSAPTMATDPSPAAEGTGASEVSATSFTPEGPNDLPMPPLPYASQMSGPAEQVRAAYVFAAQNPGLLEYVPCYCGCELDGHNSNVDCFVESRTPDGAVRAWDSHGMT